MMGTESLSYEIFLAGLITGAGFVIRAWLQSQPKQIPVMRFVEIEKDVFILTHVPGGLKFYTREKNDGY